MVSFFFFIFYEDRVTNERQKKTVGRMGEARGGRHNCLCLVKECLSSRASARQLCVSRSFAGEAAKLSAPATRRNTPQSSRPKVNSKQNFILFFSHSQQAPRCEKP